jgi:hypothetical protein
VQLCTAPPRDLIFPGQQVPYRISQTETETRPRAAQLATRSRNKNTGGRWGRIRGLGVTGGGGRRRLLRGAPHGGAKGSSCPPGSSPLADSAALRFFSPPARGGPFPSWLRGPEFAVDKRGFGPCAGPARYMGHRGRFFFLRAFYYNSGFFF